MVDTAGFYYYSLITPPPPLPINRTETRHAHLDQHHRVISVPPATAAISSRTRIAHFSRRASHGADDFGIAHFQVRGPVRGGLGADLGIETSEFVPSSSVESEVREVVCGCVEWHCEM